MKPDRILEKSLLKKRRKFLFGGKWLFRLRMTNHSADRLKERTLSENQTVMGLMNSLAEKLESAHDLANLNKPRAGESVIYFFEDTYEMVVVVFVPLQPNPDRKDDIEFDAIIETYLQCSRTYFARIRSSAKDRCIAILNTGEVIEGKHNQWFV